MFAETSEIGPLASTLRGAKPAMLCPLWGGQKELIPVLRIGPLGICSLGHLDLAEIRISEDHLKNVRALLSEILILISGIGTGNGEPVIYSTTGPTICGIFFLLLPQFLTLCTISPLEDMKFSTPLSGTATQWSANCINLFCHLALTETSLCMDCFPCIALKWWEMVSLFPITTSSTLLTICKNLCLVKVQYIWFCQPTLSNEALIPTDPSLLSLPTPVTILGDTIFHVDIQNAHPSIPMASVPPQPYHWLYSGLVINP